MAVHIVTGKLGSGKTLVSVSRIQEYLSRRRVIATNLNLKLHHMPLIGRLARHTRVIRVPDKPTLEDFQAIGRGTRSYDESENGLLVLDECGTWFNSRNWADKSRQPVIDWCLHARKLGWDVIFIIQDISLMDKQAREALAEHVVYCRRLDRFSIPIISSLLKVMFAGRVPLPKVHIGIVKYGDSQQSVTVDNWLYTGKQLYAAYDTKQVFTSNYEHGPYSLIPPYLTHGQFSVKKDFKYHMRITRIYLKKMNRIFIIFSFLALGIAAGMFYESSKISGQMQVIEKKNKEQATSTNNSVEKLPKLTINSFKQLGYDVNVTFKDANSKTYTDFELGSAGYSITVKDACHVTISKASYLQNVNCEG